jgi:membrane-associated phospholipid phosphatase
MVQSDHNLLRRVPQQLPREARYHPRMPSDSIRADAPRRRKVLVASVAAAIACATLFLALRVVVLRANGPSAVDTWIAARLETDRGTWLLSLVRDLAAFPGTRKGVLAAVLVILVWGWLRDRDVRPGVLVAVAFILTAATVAILKGVDVDVSPGVGGEEPGVGDDEAVERAFVSSHVANATALFAMLAVALAASRRRRLGRLAMILAVVVVSVVGMTVMADGLHFLTDVVSGAAVAGVWVSVLTPVAYALYVEREERAAVWWRPPANPPSE